MTPAIMKLCTLLTVLVHIMMPQKLKRFVHVESSKKRTAEQQLIDLQQVTLAAVITSQLLKHR